MGMTITEKILARAAGRDAVSPGENIWVKADVLMTHDVCGPGTIGIFQREFGREARVWNPDAVVLTPDHYIFTEDEKCLRNIDLCREFARDQGLPHFYDPGTPSYSGVCHVTLPQHGHCRPGEVMFGTDSHTCTHGAFGQFATGIGNTDAAFVLGTGKLLVKIPASMRFTVEGVLPDHVMAKDLILQIIGDLGVDGATYRAMEFCGSAVEAMSMEERMTLCNMAIEAGGKNGIVAADAKTTEYVRSRTDASFECFVSDPDAEYLSATTYKAGKLAPVVALPHSPDNVVKASECSDLAVTRVYIGSCTGGKTTDFVAAARVLKGRKVTVDTYLVPATDEVEQDLKRETVDGMPLLDIFRDAGCIDPAPPSCAACLGGPHDTFGRCNTPEVCVSTTNRNFVGRMGSKDASVILASPLTAAASAVTGYITDPRDFI
ncbi:MAG: 3-isopropylmalate dehydratase large subunit [Lentisphaerae bacterium]|nr:3-isopropylmalate dehydratase large subunit [Lentisphaerota bacterium]MBT4817991.1 3-isopropylmalate dehydratase large subunit [Lentisphaerota bacterium]MBT5605590.1 3-isopropylmalate dehydratase large subunit [Lentisphaerota bacterium]MBT7054862.1 3-isopropylmalate dehydratase large subunit [Lentisphaerota bacterium]MBT7841591.1 3-isopropylmalate dehydratase large subunit [Lentisphaerota bacterium]